MHLSFNWLIRRMVALLLFGALGCAQQPPTDDLYQRLGGVPGIEAIVDAFLVRLSEDERIVDSFADTDIGEFRRLLIEQFCDISGGPCQYAGRSMREAHDGLGITAAQFNALVEDLILAMQDAGVPLGAQNRLLGRLAPMQRDIL